MLSPESLQAEGEERASEVGRQKAKGAGLAAAQHHKLPPATDKVGTRPSSSLFLAD